MPFQTVREFPNNCTRIQLCLCQRLIHRKRRCDAESALRHFISLEEHRSRWQERDVQLCDGPGADRLVQDIPAVLSSRATSSIIHGIYTVVHIVSSSHSKQKQHIGVQITSCSYSSRVNPSRFVPQHCLCTGSLSGDWAVGHFD